MDTEIQTTYKVSVAFIINVDVLWFLTTTKKHFYFL
jgi:hypothetical protein